MRWFCVATISLLQQLMILLPLLVHDTDQLRFTSIQLPALVQRNTNFILGCLYELDSNEQLYSVKWYKDNEEFYKIQFAPSPAQQSNQSLDQMLSIMKTMGKLEGQDPPALSQDLAGQQHQQQKQQYSLAGVDVRINSSNATHVHLLNSTLESEGSYACEISTQTLSTIRYEKEIRIYVLPQTRITVHGFRQRYALDDKVDLICGSDFSRPRPALAWFINGRRIAKSDRLFEFESSSKTKLFDRSLVKVNLALRFKLNRDFLTWLSSTINQSIANATSTSTDTTKQQTTTTVHQRQQIAPTSNQSNKNNNINRTNRDQEKPKPVGADQPIAMPLPPIRLQCKYRLSEVSDVAFNELSLSQNDLLGRSNVDDLTAASANDDDDQSALVGGAAMVVKPETSDGGRRAKYSSTSATSNDEQRPPPTPLSLDRSDDENGDGDNHPATPPEEEAAPTSDGDGSYAADDNSAAAAGDSNGDHDHDDKTKDYYPRGTGSADDGRDARARKFDKMLPLLHQHQTKPVAGFESENRPAPEDADEPVESIDSTRRWRDKVNKSNDDDDDDDNNNQHSRLQQRAASRRKRRSNRKLEADGTSKVHGRRERRNSYTAPGSVPKQTGGNIVVFKSSQENQVIQTKCPAGEHELRSLFQAAGSGQTATMNRNGGGGGAVPLLRSVPTTLISVAAATTSIVNAGPEVACSRGALALQSDDPILVGVIASGQAASARMTTTTTPDDDYMTPTATATSSRHQQQTSKKIQLQHKLVGSPANPGGHGGSKLYQNREQILLSSAASADISNERLEDKARLKRQLHMNLNYHQQRNGQSTTNRKKIDIAEHGSNVGANEALFSVNCMTIAALLSNGAGSDNNSPLNSPIVADQNDDEPYGPSAGAPRRLVINGDTSKWFGASSMASSSSIGVAASGDGEPVGRRGDYCNDNQARRRWSISGKSSFNDFTEPHSSSSSSQLNHANYNGAQQPKSLQANNNNNDKQHLLARSAAAFSAGSQQRVAYLNVSGLSSSSSKSDFALSRRTRRDSAKSNTFAKSASFPSAFEVHKHENNNKRQHPVPHDVGARFAYSDFASTTNILSPDITSSLQQSIVAPPLLEWFINNQEAPSSSIDYNPRLPLLGVASPIVAESGDNNSLNDREMIVTSSSGDQHLNESMNSDIIESAPTNYIDYAEYFANFNSKPLEQQLKLQIALNKRHFMTPDLKARLRCSSTQAQILVADVVDLKILIVSNEDSTGLNNNLNFHQSTTSWNRRRIGHHQNNNNNGHYQLPNNNNFLKTNVVKSLKQSSNGANTSLSKFNGDNNMTILLLANCMITIILYKMIT